LLLLYAPLPDISIRAERKTKSLFKMKEDIASSQLQAEQGKLLDKIDELRTIGVGGIVELPQLIVCGSQSSGKSSVLEAISRVRFPAKDNVCTRFATEVVLRRTPTTTNKVSIKPGPSRHNEQELRRLRGFQHGEFHDGEDLPAIIEKAKECMGIDDSAHTGFSDDVLLVEISGPDKPELTLVDLPGLYSSTSQDQGQEGITIVRDLTEKYMQNSRSIILAVISAKADYHLQEILDIAKKFDSSLERTLGVITHPDTLEERSGLEDNYLRFIQNEKVRLKLGWHVLRNRSHGTRDATDKDRDELEKDFFNKGRWASIPRDRVGIDSLRHRLSKILLNHIRRHLPEMVTEIKEKIAERQQSRLKLGDARSTIQEQRGYLLGISSDFNKITKDALDGMYKNSFFVSLDSAGGDSIDSSRLRAVIRESNEQFLDAMAVGGFSRIIIDYEHQKMTGAAYNTATSNEYLQDWSEVYVTRKNLEIEVADHARRNRGTELPGNPNQGEVGYWFREQSQPWEELARKHLMAAWGAVDYFVSLVLDHLTDEHTYPLICGLVLEPELERMKDNVLKKLEELIYQFKRGHPLPVGKNFLKRVQQARISRDSAKLHQELNAAGGRENHESGIDPTHITKVFSNIQSSRDEFAAADIIDQMEAYYNVSAIFS
jgi:GTPase SAR1 family protein